MLIQSCYLLPTQQPTTIFCHGIVDNKTQADRYDQFLQKPKVAFDFPDAQTPHNYNLNSLIFHSCALFGKRVNRESMHMGHGADIETLKNQIKSDEDYILYGVSRGGATAISYLAQHNPVNVKAVVLDATPADVVTSIDELQHTLGCKFASDRTSQECLFNTVFPAYPCNSVPAVQDIKNIKNKNLPILIVHAHTDTRVHMRSAWQLYQAFLQAGFTNVYLSELQNGKHAFYMQGSDKDTYLKALHSFYKAYDLECNESYATMNVQELQPNLQEINDKIQIDHEQFLRKYEEQKKLNIFVVSMLLFLSATTAIYLYKS